MSTQDSRPPRQSRYPLFENRAPVRPGMRMLPRGRLGLLVVALVLIVAIARSHHANVTIPKLAGVEITRAYASAHDLGLPVSVQTSFDAGSAQCPYTVLATAPAAESRLARGDPVTFAITPEHCPPYARPRTITRAGAAAPSFTNDTLATAIAWATDHHRTWTATVPPLRGGDAPSLYANFAVIGVQHAADGTLRFTVQVS